jgi:hypothetical protein
LRFDLGAQKKGEGITGEEHKGRVHRARENLDPEKSKLLWFMGCGRMESSNPILSCVWWVDEVK